MRCERGLRRAWTTCGHTSARSIPTRTNTASARTKRSANRPRARSARTSGACRCAPTITGPACSQPQLPLYRGSRSCRAARLRAVLGAARFHQWHRRSGGALSRRNAGGRMRRARGHHPPERRAQPVAADPHHRSLHADPRQPGADRVRGRIRQPARQRDHVPRHPAALFERRRYDRLHLRRDQLEGNGRPVDQRRAAATRSTGARNRDPAQPRTADRLGRRPGCGRQRWRSVPRIAAPIAARRQACRRPLSAARLRCRGQLRRRQRRRRGRRRHVRCDRGGRRRARGLDPLRLAALARRQQERCGALRRRGRRGLRRRGPGREMARAAYRAVRRRFGARTARTDRSRLRRRRRRVRR